MRKQVLSKIKCPNFGTSDFKIFAVELERDGQKIMKVDHAKIEDRDDIKEGVILDTKNKTAYPIHEYIGSVLSDEDANQGHYSKLLTEISAQCPPRYVKIITESLERLAKAKVTDDGVWNREEMEYYDEDVSSVEKRKTFLKTIQSKPAWHIFIERKRYLLDKVSLTEGKDVLEIGCGNARTMAWVAPPENTGYNYVGIDIAWKRLLLAKEAMPGGDFLQASALNLPFKDKSFDISIAFGSIHHLPDRIAGLHEAVRITTAEGTFLLNEPIEKPQLISEKRLGWLKKMIEGYEHSEHDNDINLPEFHNVINDGDLKIEHQYVNGSIARTLMTFGWIRKLPFFYTKTSWRTIIWIDKLFIKIFCRKHGVLGPSGVSMVLSKVPSTTKGT